MLRQLSSVLLPIGAVALLPLPSVAFTPFNLFPTDVGSTSPANFSTLPSDNPTLFGFTGSDVRSVNFDTDPSGNPLLAGSVLTNEYASIGVTTNGIPLSNSVYGGAASSPNATFSSRQIFNFTVPVVAAGIVNTSPDFDLVQFFTGANGTGDLLGAFRDSGNFNVDRFVGARVEDGLSIGSLLVSNNSGALELDELVFEVAETKSTPEPTTILGATIALGCGTLLTKMKQKHNS